MDPSKDASAFAAALPPVGGLGNFKGVMLCNRPSDDPHSKAGGGGGGDEAAPFKSMVSCSYGEKLGLTPCRTDDEGVSVKKRGPSAALRRHVRWLRELQDQMKEEREQVDQEDVEGEERKKKMKDILDTHRDGVRDMMKDRAKDWVDPTRDPEKHQKILQMNAEKKAKKKKPLWAMTAEEKENFEAEEADDLINFADNLDFDKFIGDMEFRQGLDALKDRAGKLAKEQDAFKESLLAEFNKDDEDDEEERSTSAGGSVMPEDGLEGHSLFGDLVSEGGTRRRRSAGQERYGDGRPEWDGSTQCGDDRADVAPEVRDAAEMALEFNPQLKQIHSKESMQKVVEKAKEMAKQEERPADLVECMRLDGPAPIPVIVSSSDTQNRLHKVVDPSQLPYLYRSPAV